MTNEELNRIIRNLNRPQRESLERYLLYQTYPDLDNDSDIAAKKEESYRLYSSNISKLIAKVEVYAHDLPIPIFGIIENIVRIHSIVEQIEDKEEMIKGYEQIIQYEKFFINILHLILIRLYAAQVKTYKKVLKMFNHKGVQIDDSPVLNRVDEQLKEVLVLVRQGKSKLKKIYALSWFQVEKFTDNLLPVFDRFGSKEVDVINGESEIIQELLVAYQRMQNITSICEENYSEIINNGYKAKFLKRILNIVPIILSFLLTVCGALTIYFKFMG